MRVELFNGRYQDTLAAVSCDAVITDPPYGARVHAGHNAGRPQIAAVTGQGTATSLTYASWTADDVYEFVVFWSARCSGWIAAFTSDDLIDAYRDAYRRCGMYSFAPVGVVQKVPRLLGDGPSSWLRYLMVARPRTKTAMKWRCTPGLYMAKTVRGAPIAGTKPVETMAELVRDYSNPGDTIVDPCAGWGSTLIAAATTGRRAIGSEVHEPTFEAAKQRLTTG